MPAGEEAAEAEPVYRGMVATGTGGLALAVHVSYFNRSLALWEPLVERCCFGLDASVTPSLPDILAGAKPTVKVALEGKDALNINVTTALVDVLAAIAKHTTDEMERDGLRGKRRRAAAGA